ncbi:transcription factor 21-like [Branchiostoma lanceolatum]|uniref:transcription factor 21-like n=1 Tax=Branchiostoma lanceolatum TaxID=7740 RepID=UPI001132C07E
MSTGTVSTDTVSELDFIDTDTEEEASLSEVDPHRPDLPHDPLANLARPLRRRVRRRRHAEAKKYFNKQKPEQRNAANARERSRMRVLSKAFSKLKTTLPWVPPDTKLSKLDTLRLATSYISHMRQALVGDKMVEQSLHPLMLTWPYTFSTKVQENLLPEPELCLHEPPLSAQLSASCRYGPDTRVGMDSVFLNK